jgi:oligopeptide/dipeptide ABC transporter ATP-binding protein
VTLRVRGLQVAAGGLRVVRDVDLDVAAGQTLGIIGESGSGKTVTGLALLRLLPGALTARADTIQLGGRDIATLPDAAFRALRGRAMAMVFQDPAGAFNPAKRIGWHLRTVLQRRGAGGPWLPRAAAALAETAIDQPDAVLQRYPHQLSGGMLQRVLIAMVLALEPQLVIADEPTTNLDNLVEQQILALFQALQTRLGSAFVFITHDIAIAARLCSRLVVMYAGEIVEAGPAAAVLATPLHPYTAGLVATAAALVQRAATLAEIPGQLPALSALPPGCVFQPRCSHARPGCEHPQRLRQPQPGRTVRCLLHD